jgi:hypothetical protein
MFADVLDGAPSAAAVRRWRSFRISDGAAEFLKRSRKRAPAAGSVQQDERPAAGQGGYATTRVLSRGLRPRAGCPRRKPFRTCSALIELVHGHERLADYTAWAPSPEGVAPARLGQWVTRQAQQGQVARLAFPLEWERFVHELKTASLDGR